MVGDVAKFILGGARCGRCRGLVYFIEEVREDGTVVTSHECVKSSCGFRRVRERKPEKKRGWLYECLSCGVQSKKSYPECGCKGRTLRRSRTEYDELIHYHGIYDYHPITEKHKD